MKIVPLLLKIIPSWLEGKSYLHYASCHHLTWQNIIPKGEILRFKRNCSRIQDYVTQSKTLITVKRRGNLKTFTAPSEHARFITGFNCNFRAISSSMKNNWHILCANPKLGPHPTSVPVSCIQKHADFEKLKFNLSTKRSTDIRSVILTTVLTFFSAENKVV